MLEYMSFYVIFHYKQVSLFLVPVRPSSEHDPGQQKCSAFPDGKALQDLIPLSSFLRKTCQSAFQIVRTEE